MRRQGAAHPLLTMARNSLARLPVPLNMKPAANDAAGAAGNNAAPAAI
jgi:hypothetical protein